MNELLEDKRQDVQSRELDGRVGIRPSDAIGVRFGRRCNNWVDVMRTRQSERIDTYHGKVVANESKNLPGHEERLKAHEARIKKAMQAPKGYKVTMLDTRPFGDVNMRFLEKT